MCVDEVTPTWVPNLFNHIDDAFVVGNKGEKGILKYPTMKRYLDDKFGLPGNLWAVRIKDSQKILLSGNSYF